MEQKYLKYKEADFLSDDFWVKSMTTPTPETEKFWDKIINGGNIDINEFIAAYDILKKIRNNKPEVFSEKIDMLWERISRTRQNNRNNRKKRPMLWGSLVASFLVLGLFGGIALFTKVEIVSPSIAEFAQMSVFDGKIEFAKEIQIITEGQIYSIKENHANVEYDGAGSLSVNSLDVSDRLNETRFSRLCVPYGKQAKLTLSDGTILQLNSGTMVAYPTRFSGDKREVYVIGEVYAQVEKDAERPFVIKTGKIDVNVLGTEFSLSAYKEDSQTSLVLVNGVVSINETSSNQHIKILPEQLYSYQKETGRVTVENVDVERFISWKSGYLLFYKENLPNVFKRLERQYDVSFDYDEAIKKIPVSGKLILRENLNDVLRLVALTAPIEYKREDNRIKITLKNEK